MNFQRARDSEQKEARRTQILLEAEKRIAKDEFDKISMGDIACALGLGKGTVFNYFPTKESLFLSVAQAEFDNWFTHVSLQISDATDKQQLLSILLQSLRETPLLPKLISILHSVLENNVPVEQIRQFKFMLLERLGALGNQIDTQLGWRPGSGALGLINLHTLIIGCYQMAHPTPAVAKVIQDDALAVFRMDMMTQLQSMLPAVFNDLG